uniref:Small ribosomal subunit protein uS11 n=1 Tax=uncultured Chlamydiae bacterium Rifle_16ft_4_minimus_1822 TaxID=1665093 RepID=A0A0H4T4S8_9BACT|nr:30S ribosomal protein S11, small subunit ribosomal protein S11 [uncultured Chlamydiae bacterium Rifle_16ft_4_minimus_1822]
MAKQESEKAMVKKPVAKVKKKTIRSVPSGIAHVKATFNNTIIAITDLSGNVVASSSAGKSNFSGSRKSSAYAATVAAQNAARAAMGLGMKEVEVSLKGPGAGRESAVRGLQSSGLTITMIRDATPVPHNGCRPRKRRRV